MLTIERIELAYNNVYLVDDGSDMVVIDAGPDYRGARETITNALKGRQPTLVIATHGHLDHAGLGNWWQERGVPVWLGAEDVAYASGDDFTLEATARYVAESGAPDEIVREVVGGLRLRREWHARLRHGEGWPPSRDGRWPTQLRYASFEPARLLSGETDLPCGLQVLPAPGHTPGNLVVTGVGAEGPLLFSGDQLLPEITPTPAIQFQNGARFPSLPRFLEALDAIARRPDGFVRCFPGHGTPFEDVGAAVRANLEQAGERTARIEDALAAGGPATVYEVARRVYPRALRRRFWQIVATVQGHLDVLEEAGRAAMGDGRWHADGR